MRDLDKNSRILVLLRNCSALIKVYACLLYTSSARGQPDSDFDVLRADTAFMLSGRENIDFTS